MLRLLKAVLGERPRLATPAELAHFLSGRAAFVAQKCTFDYCRARAGIGWADLFRDPVFAAALDRCRWEGYVAVLEDLGEVALVYLRQQGADAAVAPGLAGVLRAALTRHPVPGHLDGWDAAAAASEARLHRALMAEPRPVRLIGRISGEAVFAGLPLHTNLKGHDRAMVVNNVRFLLCRIHDDLERAADGPALVRALSAAGGPPPAPR